MSKNGKAKFNAKLKKAKAEAAKKQAESRNSFEIAKRIVAEESENLYPTAVKPTEESVIFRGMTLEVTDALIAQADEMVDFPLADFYLEVPTKRGKRLKIHWKPVGSNRRGAIRTYLMGQHKDIYEYFNKTTLHVCSFPEENVIAEIWHEYDGIYGVSFAVINRNEKEITIPTAKSLGADTHHSTVLTPGCDVFSILSESAVEAHAKHHAKYEEYMEAISNIGATCKVAQFLVSKFLSGEEIPSIPGLIMPEREPATTTNPKHSSSPKSKKEPEKHIAYIYYDAEAGDVIISNSSRHYEAKWWIVRTHKRHLPSGKITTIPPYIKGDRDDPDAQKALAEVLSGIERIKYYQLIARRHVG